MKIKARLRPDTARLGMQRLESRFCLAGVSFLTHDIVATGANGAYSVYTADLDGDGDADVLSASAADDRIAWYENLGSGDFAKQRILSTESNKPIGVTAADIDGDGDLDVVSASNDYSVDKIAWYENLDGKGNFGPFQLISRATDGAQSVRVADIDGDGDADILVAARGEDISWFENIDGQGNFGSRRVVAAIPSGAWWAEAADIDGDGDLDVVGALWNDRTVAWYENTDGKGNFGEQRVIETIDRSTPRSVYLTDIDGDGDVDVVATHGGKIAWYENLDGAGSFGIKLVSTKQESPYSVFAADIDGDGDQDVVAASRGDGKVAWYENRDGAGSFGSQKVITSDTKSARSVYAADVDGDGDVDVLSASQGDSKVAWYENTDGLGAFGTQQLVTPAFGSAQSVHAVDLDGDADLDVLASSEGSPEVVWFENRDGQGDFSEQRRIAADAGFGISVFAADVDGDGDNDVITTEGWYANDGTGVFGAVNRFPSSPEISVHAADLDGDGDLDVIGGSVSEVVWLENTDGKGTFGRAKTVTTSAFIVRSLDAADIDGDGDPDIVAGTSIFHSTAWFENIDGAGTFEAGPNMGFGTYSVHAADVDGDGDQDVLATNGWHENTNGTGSFSAAMGSVTGKSVYTADLDLDGDPDAIAADGNTIAWHENVDGGFGERQVVSESVDRAEFVRAADIDGDGDMDVLSASFYDGKIAWYENLLIDKQAVPGDANRDGVFDSADLVLVFQASEYEDEIIGNSTFADGDWNGDGDFDSADLVHAFQAGTYVAASRGELLADIFFEREAYENDLATSPSQSEGRKRCQVSGAFSTVICRQ